MRYFIDCSYKGTNYCGWQAQENARTIQGEIEKVLSILLRKPVEIVGSSRTDTGVHAKHQTAHFDLEEAIPNPENTVYRMNKMLPFDISILNIFTVADDYHSRFEATSRKYEYHISRKKNPFLKDLCYEFTPVLNITAMNEACQYFFKYIDFESFSKLHSQVFTFNCTIMEARWEERENGILVFHIKSNRFLRGMVRAIVGTLIEVGMGKISVEDFEKIIQSKNRQKAGGAAPPQGLFLMEVNY
ncbi:tRNA pseudouridine38-40 synthase [Arcicella rosea]|uniref:tRNA pseudouridine(38-40) synthase TruA n=1 Tax=Arcicella rosea TaxID=502909 RepID=UPI00345CA6B9